jgi:hypothetical protein
MKTKKGKSKGAVAAKTSGGLIPLKRICADLGIETKPARVKLRRAWRKTDEKGRTEGNLAFHEKNARWDLTAAQAREARAILAPRA